VLPADPLEVMLAVLAASGERGELSSTNGAVSGGPHEAAKSTPNSLE
jgi:hypothetical protein